MIEYALYSLLAIGAAILLSAASRRLRRDEPPIAPCQEDTAFSRRMEAIEQQFGWDRDQTNRRG